MPNTEKTDDSIYCEKVPGSGGILSTILVAIFGTAIIAVTLCFAVNFICDFSGIDFDAFVWLQEFVKGFPELLDTLIQKVQALVETVQSIAE